MKKVFTLIIALSTAFAGFSQSCLPEGIIFTTQSEIDNFQINYPNCTQIEGNVTIFTSEWDSITNLSGLSVLTHIGGYLEIANYDLWGNSYLISLMGLEGLTEIGGDLLICNNSALTTLNGLDNLISIGGSLYIGNDEYGGNINLSSLTGLESLTDIGGDLYISNNDSLATLTGLDNLTTIGGSLIIFGNDSLSSLEGLESVITVGGTILVHYTQRLKNLSGLENLTSIGGSLDFDSNDSLTSLTGLENVVSIGYNISIYYNPLLDNIDALHNLTSLNYDVIIYGNDALASLTGFANLTSIGGDFDLSGSNLITLTGLENLTSVGGYLSIRFHPALVSLSALSGLTSINGLLDIRSNSSLINLDGLENIDAESIAQLYISWNHLLTDCEIRSICEYLTDSNAFSIIEDNITGCNNAEEILTACGVGIDDHASPESQITLSPNPASIVITISLPTTTPVDNTTLSIYNVSAQQVISRRITEPITVLDIGTLPRGVYFARITTDATVLVGKFVKQ